MSDAAHHESRPRRSWTWGVATFGLLAVTTVGGFLLQAHARRGEDPAPMGLAVFATDDTTIPDDTVLLQELEKAIELRRRETFDRVLDARDPGELIEHATLTEKALDRHLLGIDALFIVGDEMFGYLFRPENGWGSGGQDRKGLGYRPRLRRIHQGAGGGRSAA